MIRIARRSFLKLLGASAMALPLAGVWPRRRAAAFTPGPARRVIFYYFPDGIPEPAGEPSRWHMEGSDTSFTLAPTLTPLQPFVGQCVFLNGLSMGPTDAGSHPAGAKKLLTAVDHGNGESIDRYLARTVGADAPFDHVYLGAMATQNNASGDKFISYPAAGTTVAPEDDPLRAFSRLFGGGAPGGSTGADPAALSVLDTDLADLNDLRARLGDTEKSKLDLHLEALRDLEKRLQGGGPVGGTGCGVPSGNVSATDEAQLEDSGHFPTTLRAQMDVMVQAMACGLTRVGVVQASQHTSELIMSRFADEPELYTPNFDMRSHQASHYGVSSDGKFDTYVKQVRWFVAQLAYLCSALAQRPEGDGTMLDYTMVLMCSEVSDGNTHKHDNMPFLLAGGGGGALKTGRLLQLGEHRHGDLFVAMARAMGDSLSSFGDASQGPLPGLLT
jgi:hypothetical protein